MGIFTWLPSSLLCWDRHSWSIIARFFFVVVVVVCFCFCFPLSKKRVSITSSGVGCRKWLRISLHCMFITKPESLYNFFSPPPAKLGYFKGCKMTTDTGDRYNWGNWHIFPSGGRKLEADREVETHQLTLPLTCSQPWIISGRVNTPSLKTS